MRIKARRLVLVKRTYIILYIRVVKRVGKFHLALKQSIKTVMEVQWKSSMTQQSKMLGFSGCSIYIS